MKSNEESFTPLPLSESHAPVLCPHPTPLSSQPCGKRTCHIVPSSTAQHSRYGQGSQHGAARQDEAGQLMDNPQCLQHGDHLSWK